MRVASGLLSCLFAFVLTLGTVRGGESPDPSDIWYRAYLLSEKVDELQAAGDKAGARECQGEALHLYSEPQRAFPAFHPEIVRLRILQLKKDLQLSLTPPPTGLEAEVNRIRRAIAVQQKEIERLMRQLDSLRNRLEGSDSSGKDEAKDSDGGETDIVTPDEPGDTPRFEREADRSPREVPHTGFRGYLADCPIEATARPLGDDPLRSLSILIPSGAVSGSGASR